MLSGTFPGPFLLPWWCAEILKCFAVLDRDRRACSDTAIHVNQLQPAIEHHKILRLEVNMHKAPGMQTLQDQVDGTALVF